MVVLQEGIILFLSVYAGNWQQWDARSPVLSPALWDGQNVTLAVVAAKETSFLTLAWQDHGDLWPLLQIFWLPLLESIWFCYSFHLLSFCPKYLVRILFPILKIGKYLSKPTQWCVYVFLLQQLGLKCPSRPVCLKTWSSGWQDWEAMKLSRNGAHSEGP